MCKSLKKYRQNERTSALWSLNVNKVSQFFSRFLKEPSDHEKMSDLMFFPLFCINVEKLQRKASLRPFLWKSTQNCILKTRVTLAASQWNVGLPYLCTQTSTFSYTWVHVRHDPIKFLSYSKAYLNWLIK